MYGVVPLVLVSVATLAAFQGASIIAFAARIFTVKNLVAGEEVVGIARTDLGEDHATMWQNLKMDRFSVERDFEVPVLEDDPLQAVLTGKLEMRLVYGRGGQLAQVLANWARKRAKEWCRAI